MRKTLWHNSNPSDLSARLSIIWLRECDVKQRYLLFYPSDALHHPKKPPLPHPFNLAYQVMRKSYL